MNPFGLLDSWFKISIEVYIMNFFPAAGSGSESVSPLNPRRSAFTIPVFLLADCFVADSDDSRNDCVGVRAKLGRKKYLCSHQTRRPEEGELRSLTRYLDLLLSLYLYRVQIRPMS